MTAAAPARLLRVGVAALSGLLLALLAWTTLSRVGFPYELEWLEGWTVVSVQRVLDGLPLFVPPGLEYVPYVYTPLYTYLSAALSAVVGVGFLAPRLVSLLAAAGCLALTWRLVHRETHGHLPALAAAGFLAGTYPLSGTWFDIARVDTLFLLFVLAAFLLARSRPSAVGLAAAGALMACAYLTKQTALLPLAALSVFTIFEMTGWRRVILPAAAGALIGLTALAFNAASGGWYLYYTVIVPGLHGFGREEMLAEFWTRDLGWTMVPAGILAAGALAHLHLKGNGYRTAFVFYSTQLVAMVGAAWTSRLHGGGWINVLQPAHAVLALLFGLGVSWVAGLKRPALAAAGMGAAALQLALLIYNPAPHIPGEQEARDGDAFIQALAEIDGEVYTPMHGYLPVMAGKKGYALDGYLLTILRTGDMDVVNPLNRTFQEAFQRRHWAAVVIDFEDYRYMKQLEEGYRYAGDLPGSFRPRKGPRSAPQRLYLARD